MSLLLCFNVTPQMICNYSGIVQLYEYVYISEHLCSTF